MLKETDDRKIDLDVLPRWYVAETEISQELTAEHRLREKGFEVYLPMRRAGAQAKRIMAVPYFPKYIFVRLMVGAPGWTGVFSTLGVRAILGNARPLPLADHRIQEIRNRENDGFIPVKKDRPRPLFTRGQRVKLTDGPFVGFDAIFDEPVDERRVAILLSFLGRDSRVIADVHTVRAAS